MVIAELAGARLGRDGHQVLDRVDLRIEAREIIAIVGGSGSGKTTLLDTLIGLIEPMGGTARLFGHPLADMELALRRSLRSRIGVVFQHDALFQAMNVAENLAVAGRELLGLPDAVIDELVDIRLEQVGLAGLGDRRPYELSGGQQKRVAFARAVMLEPELVLCDEPTAGLDPINANRIATLIGRLRDEIGTAVLIVTHDVRLAASTANRVVVLGRGQLLATGSATALAAHPDPLVAELFHEVVAERGCS